jgi:hypothetical protein
MDGASFGTVQQWQFADLNPIFFQCQDSTKLVEIHCKDLQGDQFKTDKYTVNNFR